MTALLMTVLLAIGAAQDPNRDRGPGAQAGRTGAGSSSLDGQWTVLYMERNGQRMERGTTSNTVTIRDNTVTFTEEGKQHSMHFQFGPQHTILTRPASGQAAEAGQGRTGQDRSTAEPQARPGAPTQPGIGQGRQVRQAGYEGVAGRTPGMHQGVYIFSGDILCLGFDSGMEGQHGQQGRSSGTPGQIGQGTPGGPDTQPGQQAPGIRPGRPGIAGQPGQFRRPGDAAGRMAPGATGSGTLPLQSGFVLVLRREGSDQGTNQGDRNRGR
jgi:hypothetical protein